MPGADRRSSPAKAAASFSRSMPRTRSRRRTIYDRLRARGAAPSPFAGIPVSIKDLFDVAGDVTTAGSVVLRDAAPAARDAPCVARLRAAGFIPIGRTNMTEFAFSGLGINPHYGTPLNPYDRAAGRIPGGSSSGAAVSVTDGMAFGALGTDTGGSCRIPAALCGIVGFKPTAHRVPTAGRVSALDLARLGRPAGGDGRLLRRARCRSRGRAGGRSSRLPARRAAHGGAADHGARRRRARGGARVRCRLDGAAQSRRAHRRHSRCASWPSLAQINAKGGLAAAESYAIHRALIAKAEKMYDPRVLARILRGREQDAADYIDLVSARADFIRRVAAVTAPYDALVMPTVPVTARAGRRSRGRCDAYRQVNFARAAQSVGREFPRPLLDLDSVSSRRRRAGRSHADRRARCRSPPARRSRRRSRRSCRRIFGRLATNAGIDDWSSAD